jgi:hypothetical protein
MILVEVLDVVAEQPRWQEIVEWTGLLLAEVGLKKTVLQEVGRLLYSIRHKNDTAKDKNFDE